MNHAVEVADGNEFRLLYVIANTMSLKKEGHTKIYRDMLADKLGLSTKQITRLTNALVDKGLLKKDLVSENDKTVNYYSLNLDKIDPKSTSKVDKNVPLNKSKKNVIKEKKEIIDNKSEKKQFEIECKGENIETNTPRNIEVNKDIYTEFQQHCDDMLLECKTEKDLISTRALLSSKLRKKTFEIPRNVMNRCNSYLDTKFNELSQVVMAESSTDEDFSFLD